VREEHAAAQEHVRAVAGDALETLEERAVDAPRPELLDQLVVVDRELLPVRGHRALHVPRRHYLRVRIAARWCRRDWLATTARRGCGPGFGLAI
jgi:hypothetical protein